MFGAMLKNIQNWGVWDFAVFKLALLVLGCIIGAYATLFVKQYVVWFWIVFVVSYIYIMYKTFKK